MMLFVLVDLSEADLVIAGKVTGVIGRRGGGGVKGSRAAEIGLTVQSVPTQIPHSSPVRPAPVHMPTSRTTTMDMFTGPLTARVRVRTEVSSAA